MWNIWSDLLLLLIEKLLEKLKYFAQACLNPKNLHFLETAFSILSSRLIHPNIPVLALVSPGVFRLKIDLRKKKWHFIFFSFQHHVQYILFI